MKKNINEKIAFFSLSLNIILIAYVLLGSDTIVYFIKSLPFYKTVVFLLELESRILELETGNMLLSDKIIQLTKENELLKTSKIIEIKNTFIPFSSFFQLFTFISGAATLITCIHTIIQSYTNFTSILNINLSDFFFPTKEIQTINLHKPKDLVNINSLMYLKKCAEIYKSPTQTYVNSLEKFSDCSIKSENFTVCKLAQYLNEYLSDNED